MRVEIDRNSSLALDRSFPGQIAGASPHLKVRLAPRLTSTFRHNRNCTNWRVSAGVSHKNRTIFYPSFSCRPQIKQSGRTASDAAFCRSVIIEGRSAAWRREHQSV